MRLISCPFALRYARASFSFKRIIVQLTTIFSVSDSTLKMIQKVSTTHLSLLVMCVSFPTESRPLDEKVYGQILQLLLFRVFLSANKGALHCYRAIPWIKLSR